MTNSCVAEEDDYPFWAPALDRHAAECFTATGLCATARKPLSGKAMVDSFFLHVDWTTVAMVIGLLASLIAILFYGQRDRV
jgi:disulfide bond formation protein DsbB